MDKLTMAHDCALAYIKYGDGKTHYKDVVEFAWQYADAMQAEADKRINKERPDALCEVDWRVAPEWAKYWAFRDGSSAFWCTSKPAYTDDCLMSHGVCSSAPSFGFTGSHIVERPHGF